MKIRKTMLKESELNIFIYENKKDEYFVIAIPAIEWSSTYTYDDFGDELIDRLTHSLNTKVNEEEAKTLAHRLNQWTREM